MKLARGRRLGASASAIASETADPDDGVAERGPEARASALSLGGRSDSAGRRAAIELDEERHSWSCMDRGGGRQCRFGGDALLTSRTAGASGRRVRSAADSQGGRMVVAACGRRLTPQSGGRRLGSLARSPEAKGHLHVASPSRPRRLRSPGRAGTWRHCSHRDNPGGVGRGLDNPRDLDVGRGGTVYVVEAGRGGSGPCLTGRRRPGLRRPHRRGDPDPARRAASPWRACPRWRGSRRESDDRPVGHLPPPLGRRLPDRRPRAESGRAGTAQRARPGLRPALQGLLPGDLRPVADISAYEAAANPDGGAFDSNPNSVTTKWGKVFVVDAGGNGLLRVHRSGDLHGRGSSPIDSSPRPRAWASLTRSRCRRSPPTSWSAPTVRST